MVDKKVLNILKENKTLFSILSFELVAIICLTIALLITHFLKSPTNGNDIGTTTIERKSCNTIEYKMFNDRLFYYPDSKEMDERLLSVFSDYLTTNYLDPNIKVLIESTPVASDNQTIIRGYQIVDGVILKDTFFAIDAEESSLSNEFPILINPDQIEFDGLIEENKAESIAYSAIETEAKQNNKEIKGTCSYELFFTKSSKGIISELSSNFYYEYTFNFNDNEKNTRPYPKGFVYLDGKTGKVLDSFIDTGIRT